MLFSVKQQKIYVFFFITLMSVQIIPLEGMDVSIVKAICMSIAPVILLLSLNSVKVTNALLWGTMYFIFLITCSLLALDNIQWDRIVFRGLYIYMFVSVVQIVEFGTISIKSFQTFIKCLLYAYFIIAILQQICLLIGILDMPLFNLIRQKTPDSFWKVNSLAIESSHAARIVTILFYTYIRIKELIEPNILSIKQYWSSDKLVIIGYLYFIISIGSATGLIGLLIICVYFLRKNLISSLLLIAIVVIIITQFMSEQMDRISAILVSFPADDISKQMVETEASGAARLTGIVNTFQHLDLTTKEAWIGQGTSFRRTFESIYGNKNMIGDITNYGIITYCFSLIFVYRTAISRLFSFETLIFIALLGAGIGSNYYIWSALLLFYMIKFYEKDTCQYFDN